MRAQVIKKRHRINEQQVLHLTASKRASATPVGEDSVQQTADSC